MKINLYELKEAKDSIDISYEEDLSYLSEEIDEVIKISPISVKGKASKISDIYQVEGEISVEIIFNCVRCLNDFKYTLENNFQEIYTIKGSELDYESEDDDIATLESDELDLQPIVEEAVILALPYIPICSKDCKGLCPTCGVNLNETTCDCKNEKVDPRLADLAKWFDQNDITE